MRLHGDRSGQRGSLYRSVRGSCHVINTGAMFIAPGSGLPYQVVYTDSYKFSIDWKAIAWVIIRFRRGAQIPAITAIGVFSFGVGRCCARSLSVGFHCDDGDCKTAAVVAGGGTGAEGGQRCHSIKNKIPKWDDDKPKKPQYFSSNYWNIKGITT